MLRPFDSSDLAPRPPEWRVGPPDFVAVGCGRAGSTWLWSLLLQHPQVVAGRLGVKELHYFQHFGWDGPDAGQIALYRRAFAAPAGSVCGDGSFNYLTHPLAIDHLWRTAPEAKIIVVVRNPIDRFVSSLNQLTNVRLAWLGLEAERAYVQRTYSFWCEAATLCRIADGVRALTGRWATEQILVLQYEQCVLDPGAAMVRMFRFLGIDEAFVPSGLADAVNRRAPVIAPPDSAARLRLAEYFAADVDAVMAAWPSLDRALWTDFA